MAKAPKGVEIVPKIGREASRVLTADALRFVAELHRAAAPERARLAGFRHARQASFDKGALPDFRPEASAIRNGDWKAAALPRDLADQRAGMVTAPARGPLLAALNSGAKICLADFADFTSPAWDNLIDGQVNLMDRWTSAMEHVDPVTKKRVSLSQRLASLMIRPRALGQDEPRVRIDGKPVAAALFDAGLYLFHNAKVALAKASGPYLALPSVISQLEARAWNDILLQAQSLLGLAAGSVRVSVTIDDIGAAFEMDEIGYELREHIAGLSADGTKLAFSAIGCFAGQKTRIAAADGHHGAALAGLLIRTAHRRGMIAMAGLARRDIKDAAEDAVRQGFDGQWASHPDQAGAIVKIFNDGMPTPNQTYVTRDDAAPGQKDLLFHGGAQAREADFRETVRVALIGLEGWLGGRGAVLVDGMMEDRASIEFRRAQIWQWLRHGVKLDTGAKLNAAMFEASLAETLKQEKSADGHFKEAAALLKSLCLAKEFVADVTPLAMRKIE